MQKLNMDFETSRFWKDEKSRRFNGGKLTEDYEMFNLDPGKYVFCFVVGFSKEEFINNKKLNYSVKIGSTSECDFEELEDKNSANIKDLFEKIKV